MKMYKCVCCNMFQCTVPDSISLERCPICQNQLQNDEFSDDWMGELYTKEKYWFTRAFDEFPSILAHEYWRLREMMGAKQPYGIYFQIRDVMESILKYEVLLSCAWACSAKVIGFKEKVACQITDRNMSLGSWYELGRKIFAFFENDTINGTLSTPLPTVLMDALGGILSEYGDNSEYLKKHKVEYKMKYGKDLQSMVCWRNEKIGHGALGFEEDEEFRADIICMIERFKALFERKHKDAEFSVGEAIIQQKLWADDIELVGHGLADLDQDRRIHSLRIHNPLQLLSFDVSPYIMIVHGKVFFFDNQKSEKRTQQQCYTNGWRRDIEEPYFTELVRLNRNANIERDISSKMRIKEEDDLLNRLALVPRFIEPQYLVEWLREVISTYAKGVFCLKMPRGSGKSTFSEKLNCLNRNHLCIYDDLDVRTYHISRTQMIKSDDFERQIEEQWRHDYEGKTEWTGYKQIKDYRREGYMASVSFSMFLNDCCCFSNQVRSKKRILMVIDGLDEIAEEKIWEYLPTEEQLNTGVFILYTSRNPEMENLPRVINQRIGSLSVTDNLDVNPGAEGNRHFLKAYFKSYVDVKRRQIILEREIELLMKHAEYRVLYFGLMCKLVNSGFSISALTQRGELVLEYLKVLRVQYGEKEYNKLEELLGILCIAGGEDPLSLHEIAETINNGDLSLSLLSKMHDIAPLIKIQRGYVIYGVSYTGENRYIIANEDMIGYLHKCLPDIPELVKKIISAAVQRTADSKYIHTLNSRKCNLFGLSLLYKERKDGCINSETGRLVLGHCACSIENVRSVVEYLSFVCLEYNKLDLERRERALKSLHDLLCASRLREGWVEVERSLLNALADTRSFNLLYASTAAQVLEEEGRIDEAIQLLSFLASEAERRFKELPVQVEKLMITMEEHGYFDRDREEYIKEIRELMTRIPNEHVDWERGKWYKLKEVLYDVVYEYNALYNMDDNDDNRVLEANRYKKRIEQLIEHIPDEEEEIDDIYGNLAHLYIKNEDWSRCLELIKHRPSYVLDLPYSRHLCNLKLGIGSIDKWILGKAKQFSCVKRIIKLIDHYRQVGDLEYALRIELTLSTILFHGWEYQINGSPNVYANDNGFEYNMDAEKLIHALKEESISLEKRGHRELARELMIILAEYVCDSLETNANNHEDSSNDGTHISEFFSEFDELLDDDYIDRISYKILFLQTILDSGKLNNNMDLYKLIMKLSSLYEHNGERKKAIVLLQKAVDQGHLIPDDYVIRLVILLAQLYKKEKEFQKAKEYLDVQLSRDIGNDQMNNLTGLRENLLEWILEPREAWKHEKDKADKDLKETILELEALKKKNIHGFWKTLEREAIITRLLDIIESYIFLECFEEAKKCLTICSIPQTSENNQRWEYYKKKLYEANCGNNSETK